jgi:DNA-binding transcriptional LysR family regulator
MDLRHLHHILLLADERNFSRAAARAHLTQSAFSRSIQTAESLAGVKFFDRTPHRVTPTTVGARIIERGRRLLDEAGDLDREIRYLEAGISGDVHIGAGTTVAASFLAGVTVQFHHAHPNVGLNISVSHWHVLRDDLRAGRIDFFIADTLELINDTDLTITLLPPPPGSLFCRAGHPLLTSAITRERLSACDFTSTPLPASMAGFFTQLLKRPADQPLLAVECNSIDVLRRVTLETDAILGTLRLAVANELASGALVDLWPHLPSSLRKIPPPHSRWGIVRPAGRTQSPAAEHFMSELAAAAQAGYD